MANEVAVLGVGMHPVGQVGTEFRRVRNQGLPRRARGCRESHGRTFNSVPVPRRCGTVIPATSPERPSPRPLGWSGARVATSYAACASGATGLNAARAQILAGLCDVALVVGADTTPKGFLAPNAGERWDDPDWLRFRLMGATNPTYFALYARRRMELFGATEEDFAAVKVKNSRHGLTNKNARYQKAFTMEQVLEFADGRGPAPPLRDLRHERRRRRDRSFESSISRASTRRTLSRSPRSRRSLRAIRTR